MNLKSATIFVLVCVCLSLAWTLASLFLPNNLLHLAYETKLPSLLYAIREISMLVFFAILFKNQVTAREK
jgi:hypothetical protein